jgi:hypothetical protein
MQSQSYFLFILTFTKSTTIQNNWNVEATDGEVKCTTHEPKHLQVTNSR